MPKGVYIRTKEMRVKNQSGEKNHMWKGNNVGYDALHDWVTSRKGRPQSCEFCGNGKGRYEWASKSRKYRRNLDDWIRLCSSCHGKYDNIYEKAWITRRQYVK
jgi:hypothetical protein